MSEALKIAEKMLAGGCPATVLGALKAKGRGVITSGEYTNFKLAVAAKLGVSAKAMTAKQAATPLTRIP